MKPKFEVAHVLQAKHSQLEQLISNTWKLRTLYALAACRTPLLGGHIDKCTNSECNRIHISYNSCRNRHCPKCQGHKKEEWIHKRESELLKVPYFHVVFTLPSELNQLALHKPKVLYTMLFKVAWKVLDGFAANPKFLGAKTGMIAILHTWGQNLALHPHLHCIVPGGGLSKQGKWRYSKSKGKYLFPVKEMSRVFRAQFVQELRKQCQLPAYVYKALFEKRWTVYCKQPFYNTAQIIEYLGRYTHKIAISNHRIINIDKQQIILNAKDYRKGGQKYKLSLSHQEFIRRFALHILPKAFVRIRHYGIMASTIKKKNIVIIAQQIGSIKMKEHEPLKLNKCSCCKIGDLITIATFDSRGPPQIYSAYILKNSIELK